MVALNARVIRAAVVAVLAGVANVFQTGINTELSDGFDGGVTALQAAFVNFTVGTTCVILFACVHRPGWDGIEKDGEQRPFPPWYAFFGGCCGAVYVSCSILLSKKLGIALYYVVLVTGTLVLSLVIDYKGFLDLSPKTITLQMIVSVLVLVGGCIMVQDLTDDQGDLSGGEKAGYSVIVFFSGFLLPIQAALNRAMQNSVGTPFRAAVVSFFIGTVTVGIFAVGAFGVEGTSSYSGAPIWSWSGGILGAFFVTAAILSVPLIGAGWYYCFMIASQLCTAFVFDSTGFLGYEQRTPTPLRIVGIIVACLAVILYSMPPIFGGKKEETNADEAVSPVSSNEPLADPPRVETSV